MSYSRQRRRILSPATRLQGVTPPPTPVGPIDPRLMMSSGLRDNMRAEEDAYNQRDQDQAYLAQQQAREQERADKAAEAAQKKAEAQSQKLSTYAKKKEYDAAGINSEMDALGNVVAKKDAMTGKTDYRDMQAPVQYPETGKPYQMKRGEDGKMKQEFPDAKATIGDNPNDPKDPAIYRKNKAAPWDRIDPQEGLLSPEPEVKRESSQRLLNDERKALQREAKLLEIEGRNPDNQLPSKAELEKMRLGIGSEYENPKNAEILKRAEERDVKVRRQNEIATRILALETTSPDDYAAERLAKLDPNTVQAKRADLMKQKSAGIKALEAKLLEEEASLQADYQAFVPQTQGFRADQEAGIREKLGQFRLRKQMVAAKRQSLEQSMTEFNKFGEDIYQQATAASQAKAEKESIGTPAVDAKPGAPKTPAPALPIEQAYEQAKTGQIPWKQSMENQRSRLEYLKADGTIPETAKVAERWQQVLESMDPEAGGEDSGAAINAAFQTMQAEMQAAGAKDSAANEKMRNQAKADAEYLNNLAQSGEIFTADTPEQQASAEAWGRSQFAYDNEDSPSYFAPWGELSINPTLFFKDDAYTSAVDSATAPPHAKERAMQALPALQQGLAAPVFEAFLTAGGIAGSFKESIKKTADQNKWTGKGGKDIAQVVSRWTPEEKVQAVKDFMASPDYSPNWNQVALGASGGADAIQQQYYGMKAYFGIDQAGSQKAGEEEMRQQEVQGAARQTSGGSQPLGALTQGAMSLIPSIAAGVASGGAMALVGGSAAAVSSAALVGGSIGAGMQSAGSTMIEATKGIARKEANARSIDGIDPTPGAPISNAGLVEARVLSTVSGAITATLTRLGGATGSEAIFGAMFGGATKAAVLPAVQRTFVQKVIKGAGDFTYHGAREAFMEELPDQALQNVLAQNTFNPERDLEEGLWETTWVSFLLGGGMNAVTKGAGAIKEKFNGAKLTEKYAQAVTLGQGVAMAQSPDIITDALAGSPLEARTPEVLSTLAEIDARIVDGMAELDKATTPAAKLYSNKQLAFAYAEREAAVVALKKELNAARLNAAMEEIDAALPPEEEATPGMSTLPTANEKAFAEDKRRAKGLIKIAAGQEQSLDEDELNLLGLARDDKGKLIEATFTSDASGVTIRSGSRVKIEDGKLVIRQGTIDRMVALFPKTEPLIGKSEAQRRAEIQAQAAAAEAAKAAPATGTAPDPSATSPAATPATAPAASPTTAPAASPNPAATPAAGMQTFAVEVEGMADPVMMDAANVEQAKDMAFAAYPGKIIRSVKATGSAPTSNAAPAAKDSSTVDFKESEQSLKDKLNNPGKPKTAPALEEQTTYTDLADLQQQSKARLVDGWTLTSNMSSKVDGKTTNTARWSKPAEPAAQTDTAAPEAAPAAPSVESEAPPTNSDGQLLPFRKPSKKGTTVTRKDGMRGDIISESDGMLSIEWRDGTTSEMAESDLKSRSKETQISEGNNVKVSVGGVGTWQRITVTTYDKDGNPSVIYTSRKIEKVSDETFQQEVLRANEVAKNYAQANNLAGYRSTNGTRISVPKLQAAPAAETAPEVPQNETPAPDTAAPDVTPAGITKALAATVKGKPSKKQAKRFVVAGKALSKEIARWKAAFPGGIRLVTGTPSSGVLMGRKKLELLLDMPRLVESIEALGDNPLGWVEDAMIEEAIHAVVERLVQEGKLDLMGIWNEIPAETKATTLKAYTSNSDPENQAHEFFRLWLQDRLKRAKGGKGNPAFTEANFPAKAYALLKDALDTLLKYFRDMAGTLRKQGASEDTIGRVMAGGDLIEAMVRALDAETAPVAAPAAPEANNKAGSNASGDPNAVVGTFTTAKGSTYKIYGDGTTERNKAARDDVGHEGDSGAKPRTVRTIYVAGDASSLSAAGLTLPNPEKGARVIIKDGKASMLTWNDAAGQWGVAPESRDIAFFDEPAVGRSPLELWRPKTDVQGYEAYSGMHAGNKITKITPAPAAPETPAASITPENREALKQVAKMFNPDGNGTQEGRGYATQILDGLRIIDAGEMAGGMERLRGVATNARPQYPSAADALDDTLNKMEGAANAESEEAAPDPIRDLILSDESRLKKAMAMKKLSVERGETVKQTQEYIESRLVQIADEIARGDGTPEEKYAELVRIYDQQPLFSSRTSTSMENQAYSTPIPMAYVLGHMTGVTPQTSVYDGTAGNGVLAIGADLENSVANEIDSTRRQGLESMGIGTITDKDATLAGAFPSNHAKVDVVHLNPPFGTIPNVNYQGYGMRKLEHIITVRALEEAMKANGTAAIIMGATMNSQEQSKGAQWVFENYLYGNYNVVDNFEVTGDLYGNQGAKWPVRILVLAGKRTNPVKAELAPKTVDRLNTWPEVWERAQRTRYEVERQRQTLGTEGQSPVSPDSPEGATQPKNEGAIPGGKRGSSGKAPKRGRSGGNRPGKPDPAKQPGVGSPAVAPPGLVQQPQDSTPASEPPVGGGKPAPRVEGGSGGRPDGSGGRPGDSTRGGGATGSGNGTPQNAGGLTPAQIRLKALAARLDSGGNISSAPIEQAYSRDIPRSEAAELRDIAESLLFDDGIDTPALLAETLQALGLQNLSENVWSGIRALKASLPATVDWSGTYRSLKPNKPPEKPDAPRKKATATETQIPYDPESNGAPFETLIPRGIGEAVRAALEEITANRGPIDEYVAGELDMSVEDLLKAMSAEQVDGVAMAIYQMETGGALIIGDETGIGKGRQAASLIRYAVRKGKIPVFFTKDPKLFSDMWGDLQDINTPMSGPNASATDLSVRPLIFGAQDTARIVTPEGALVLKPATLPQQRSIFARARTDGFAQQGYNAIFTTYSQIRKENDRQAFLEWLAENDDVVIVLDEAHEAAGNADSSMQAAFMMGGTVTKGSGPEKVETTKSGLLNGKGAMHPRGGALYLSATFAKRPDNMPVYFRTDLRKAGEGIGQVVDAMSNGGVALQQAVTEALAEAGQYIRRERDFTGVSYSMKRVQVDDEADLVRQVDEVTEVLLAISNFSSTISASVAASTALSDNQQAMTEFASIVHNQVGQLLLAAKADAVVAEVLAAKERGEKPIVALMNTMESFLSQYIGDMEINVGDAVQLSWSELLQYALSRTLRVSEKMPDGSTQISTVDPEEFGLGRYYQRVMDSAKDIQVTFPVSPIDYIIQKAELAGVKMGELTGRQSGIQYTDFTTGAGTYKTFKKANKNTLVNGFNGGALDAMLLNASGSTGLSIHASEKFKDQQPRHMIIAQPALDINVFIQTLGRIKRTGIVMKGQYPDGSTYGARYSHLTLPLNAELRPAVMAARKMKSLNANTTGESDSAVKIEAEDLMNRFGNRAVAEYLNRNPELASALNLEIDENKDGEVTVPAEVARQFTGRMSLRPDAEQGAAYAEIIADYRRAIEQAKVTGDYDLEIIVHDDWDGVQLNAGEQIITGTDESSILTASVYVQPWEITDNRPTPSGAEMLREFQKENGSVDAAQTKWEQFAKKVDDRLNKMVADQTQNLADAAEMLAEMQEDDAGYKGQQFTVNQLTRNLATTNKKMEIWGATKLRMDEIIDRVGQVVQIEQTETNELDQGMLTQIKYPDLSKGLRIAPSAFKFTYLLDRPGGRIYPSLAQFRPKGYSQSSSNYTIDELKGDRGGKRQTRTIIVGNPVRAYAATGGKGKVVRFKSRDGELVTGLMMPRNWRIKQLVDDPRMELTGGASVARYFANMGYSNGYLESGENIRLQKGGFYKISAPVSRRTGKAIFFDKRLIELAGEFTKTGNRMVATFYDAANVAMIADRITEITGKRLRGQDMSLVQKANGVDVDGSNATGSKRRPKSAVKEAATKAWTDYIEGSDSTGIQSQPVDALSALSDDAPISDIAKADPVAMRRLMEAYTEGQTFSDWKGILKKIAPRLERFAETIWRNLRNLTVAIVVAATATTTSNVNGISLREVKSLSPENLRAVAAVTPTQDFFRMPPGLFDEAGIGPVQVAQQPKVKAPAPPAARPADLKQRTTSETEGYEVAQAVFLPKDIQQQWLEDGFSTKALTVAAEFMGQKEGQNAILAKIFNHYGITESQDSYPWCATFTSFALTKGGRPAKIFNARGFMEVGTAAKTPVRGDVVVLWNENPKTGGKTGWGGHVGLYLGETPTHVIAISGNAGDEVNVSAFHKERVLGIRRVAPKTATIQSQSPADLLAQANVSRHASLEKKYNDGTITAEETAEAQALVDKAAEAAGYNVGPVYHNSPTKGITSFMPFAMDLLNGSKTSAEIRDRLQDWRDRAAKGVNAGYMNYRAGTFFSTNETDYKGYGENQYRVFLKVTNALTKPLSGVAAPERRDIPYDALYLDMDGDGKVEEIAIFDPAQIKSADPFTGVPLDQRFNPSSNSTIQSQSPADLLKQARELKKRYPQSAMAILHSDSPILPRPAKKKKNPEVGAQLQGVAIEKWGRKITSDDITPEEEAEITNIGVEEFIAAYNSSGKTASDWYSIAIEAAMEVARVLHPELLDPAIAAKSRGFKNAEDPVQAAQLAMRIALAITSQNLSVELNTRHAEEQFEIFKTTGAFDASRKYGEKAMSISGNLDLANRLISKLGFRAAEAFIRGEFTVKELSNAATKALGRKVNVTGKMDDAVNGAAIFGPKIGQGFLQNILGEFWPVTIDLWLRRTWGRWTGDVIGRGVDGERLARFLDAARKDGIDLGPIKNIRAVDDLRKNGTSKFRTVNAAVQGRIENDDEFVAQIFDVAKKVNAEGQKQYKLTTQPVTPAVKQKVENGSIAYKEFIRSQIRVGERIDAAFKVRKDKTQDKEKFAKEWYAKNGFTAKIAEPGALKPDWSKAANVIVKSVGPIDVPGPQDRRVITRIVQNIQKELTRRGYQTTNADVQAVLWYPEKDLWAKLRGEDESNLKSSYDEEFIKLAEQRGLGNEAKRVAAAVVKRRSRGTSRTGSPDVTQPDGRVLGRVDQNKQAKERQSIQSQSPADLLKQAQAQDAVPEAIRYMGITDVVQAIRDGNTDTALKAVNQVIEDAAALRDRVRAESERRAQPRQTGKPAIMDQIVRGMKSGKLDAPTAKTIIRFINGLADSTVEDTALSMRSGKGTSSFDFGEALTTLFFNQSNDAAQTAIHEFWHGLSRFLPTPEVAKMRKDYQAALAKYLVKNPGFFALVGRYALLPDQFEDYSRMATPTELAQLQGYNAKGAKVNNFAPDADHYKISFTKENYRYVMLDEWIAETMADRVMADQPVTEGFMGQMAAIFRKFWSAMKVALGRDPYERFRQAVMGPDARQQMWRNTPVEKARALWQSEKVATPFNQRFSAIYSQSPADLLAQANVSRHSALEAKHNAGTITTAETAEAQALVDEAAKAAGMMEVFHGGDIQGNVIDTFRRERGAIAERRDGTFYMSTNPKVAETYPGANNRLFVRLNNPFTISTPQKRPASWTGKTAVNRIEQRKSSLSIGEAVDRAKANGYDGVIYGNIVDVGRNYQNGKPADVVGSTVVAFDPSQIKSATPFTGVPLDQRFNSASDSILQSQSPADLLAQANVSMAEVDALAATASAESDGDRTIGDPTRAGGAGTGVESDLNDVMLAASNIYADDIKEMAPQRLADLDAVVRGQMEADPEGNLTRLIRDGMRGVPGNAFDVRMRQMLKEWLARQPATQERREQAAALTMGDHLAKRTASQILGASRDMWVTKAERFRAFMMDHIYTPPPGTRYKILNAPTEEEREALLKQDQERIQRIIDALAKMGVTIEDVLNGGRKLLARRGEMNRTTLKDMDAKKMAAAMDTMDATQSFKDIAAKNGMTVEQVKAAKAEAMAKVMEELRNRRKMAQRAQGIISSQPVGDDPWVTMDFENMAKMSDADAEVEMERIMKELGWFADAQQGKRRTTKRRVPKTPPARDGSAKGPRKSIPQPELELEIVSIFHGMDIGNQVDVVRMKHIVDTASGSGLDVLREIYINWLLSGPVTQATNIVGNVAFGIWNTVLVRAGESTVNAMTGNNLKDSASFGEFIHIFRAAVPGMIRGAKMAKMAWGAEHDFFETMGLGDAVGMGGSGLEQLGGRKAISERPFRKISDIGGNLNPFRGRVVRMPGRSLMAADSGLKTFFGTMEVAAHAYRLTRKAGIAPGSKAFDDSMNRMMYMAGSPAWDAAVKQAEYNAFQQELNEAKNPVDGIPMWLMELSKSENWVKKTIGTVFFPFVKTPYNIAKTATVNSPLGTAYLMYLVGKGGLAAFKGGKLTFAGEPEFVTTVARQILAWAAYFALQAISEGDEDDDKKKFLITGSPPKNRGEADLQKRALGGAYMARFGGVSFNYGRLEPFATVVASTVDALRSIKRGDSSPEVLTNVVTSLMYQARNKTFLTGLASIGDMLEGRTYGKEYTEILREKVISSIIPNLIKQPMRNWADTEMDTSDAPWWHSALPLPSAVGTKLDPATGEEKLRTGNSMTRMLIPSASVPNKKLTLSDKVLLEWNRLRQNDGSNDEEGNPGKAWAPKLPSPTRKLPNQQDIELNEFARNYLVKRRAVLAQKALAGMPLKPDQTSIDLIKKAYLDGSTQAWNEIKYRPSATLGTIKK